MRDKFRVIELTRGYIAIIDSADFRRVNKHSWRVHKSRGKNRREGEPYARATIKGKDVYLHRFITGAELPWHVDHRNNESLDCRRENLLVTDHATNQRNRRNAKANRNKLQPANDPGKTRRPQDADPAAHQSAATGA